jgi:hypothetical protein
MLIYVLLNEKTTMTMMTYAKKKMLVHLVNFKINLKLKIQKSMQCKHNNNNIKAITSIMNIAIEKEPLN